MLVSSPVTRSKIWRIRQIWINVSVVLDVSRRHFAPAIYQNFLQMSKIGCTCPSRFPSTICNVNGHGKRILGTRILWGRRVWTSFFWLTFQKPNTSDSMRRNGIHTKWLCFWADCTSQIIPEFSRISFFWDAAHILMSIRLVTVTLCQFHSSELCLLILKSFIKLFLWQCSRRTTTNLI